MTDTNRPNPTGTTATAVADRGPANDDPRPALATALTLAGSVMAGVWVDQLEGPTPCTGYDVSQLMGHLLGVVQRIAVVGWGEDPASVPEMVDLGDDWSSRWADAVADVETAWSDPGILQRPARLTFATLPGALAVAIYVSEVTVHTWDLATATGQHPAWDDDVIAVSMSAMEKALPADLRGDGIPFDAPTPVADDAAPIERLVAWTGRRP